MDVLDLPQNVRRIECIEMHTTGEPTRIILKGLPELQGNLLEQRAQAKEEYDHLRTYLMLEPRGHWDMYGAWLRPETELTSTGEADMGVLFMHNEGFSTMCGHATIALGRFLVDTHDLKVFPKRDALKVDKKAQTIHLNLHAPCCLIRVTVPVTNDGQRSDPTRPVSFISVASFATAPHLDIPIPFDKRWPEFKTRTSVKVAISYGGAFYCLVRATDLGFANGLGRQPDLHAMETAAYTIQDIINSTPELRAKVRHQTESEDLGFLYSVLITDDVRGSIPAGVEAEGAETGLCYFADHQIDRSPTGSAVAARLALAYARGERDVGQRWAFNSLVSDAYEGKGAFVGAIVEECKLRDGHGRDVRDAVRVRVEGHAYYTGAHTFVMEEGDVVSEKGFSMKSVAQDLT